MPVTIQRAKNRSAWFILMGTVVLFVLISMYNVLEFYQYALEFGVHSQLPRVPISHYFARKDWRSPAESFIFYLIVWTADALIIYRCYIVWQRSWKVVILPCLLLLVSIGTNSAILAWRIDRTTLTWKQLGPIVASNYPVNIALNCITTGLISFHIWRGHVASRKAGLMSAGVNLSTVLRIVIESASIYTVQQFILLVISYLGHPAQFLFFGPVVSSIGIVFLLVVIRTHAAQSSATAGLIVIPTLSQAQLQSQSHTTMSRNS
ncbi:hypothetical protein FA15DRAFT_707017 [Coprinopsis marcescibilis]|uniref:Uncharacterized protein n=1 Tax=Coprinopsis marcescibilis TaxID=230819 RepID=A0A5C3KNP7_COPMA|nr:hypothetical protein FA15DRAFT_707017 [Coprinopsis marcescibilis]